MKFLVMQFSSVSYYFVPLRFTVFLSTLFSDTFGLYSSLNFRDQISHTHTNTKLTGLLLLSK
jgi:hypothetical protein